MRRRSRRLFLQPYLKIQAQWVLYRLRPPLLPPRQLLGSLSNALSKSLVNRLRSPSLGNAKHNISRNQKTTSSAIMRMRMSVTSASLRSKSLWRTSNPMIRPLSAHWRCSGYSATAAKAGTILSVWDFRGKLLNLSISSIAIHASPQRDPQHVSGANITSVMQKAVC